MIIPPFFLKPMAILQLTGSIISLVCTTAAMATDWPNYRGPQHDGISNETLWQTKWENEEPKIRWRTEVGIGSSSIVTHDGKAFTMGNHGNEDTGEKDTVYCLDAASGKINWTHSYPCPRLPKYYEGGTLATPTVDGNAIYTLSKMGDLFCLDISTGEVIWEQQLHRKLGFTLPTWHFSGSPLVVSDRIILNMGSAGAAFDKHTGALLWDNGHEPCGYATPVPATFDDINSVLIGGADSVLGVSALDGQVLWRYPFFNKNKANCGDPIVVGNMVFISSAYGRGCAKIQIINNQVTQVFDNRVMRNLQSSSILWKDYLYGFDDAQLKCIDFKDSTDQWQTKGFGKGSLSMCADGRMLIMSDRGVLVIAQAKHEAFEEIVRTRFFPPRILCRTAPVLSNGNLFLRNSEGALLCVDVSQKER
jgi:outer membrane protein assembly factor BamB